MRRYSHQLAIITGYIPVGEDRSMSANCDSVKPPINSDFSVPEAIAHKGGMKNEEKNLQIQEYGYFMTAQHLWKRCPLTRDA